MRVPAEKHEKDKTTPPHPTHTNRLHTRPGAKAVGTLPPRLLVVVFQARSLTTSGVPSGRLPTTCCRSSS